MRGPGAGDCRTNEGGRRASSCPCAATDMGNRTNQKSISGSTVRRREPERKLLHHPHMKLRQGSHLVLIAGGHLAPKRRLALEGCMRSQCEVHGMKPAPLRGKNRECGLYFERRMMSLKNGARQRAFEGRRGVFFDLERRRAGLVEKAGERLKAGQAPGYRALCVRLQRFG